MKQRHLLYIGLLMLLSCHQIDEADRLIEVETARIARAVLIEDFTGQRCVNCPNAALEIERLQAEYGKDHVIAVAIHSGPLAVYSNEKVTGLRTQLGDDYYDYWKVESEPSGLINRKGGVALLSQWPALVHQELQQKAIAELVLTQTAPDHLAVGAHVTEPFKGKLQLWLTEDSIIAPQMMPDGTMNRDYVHYHVLRAAVNGTWGTDVDWQPGSHYTLPFSVKVEDGWNTDRLSVVAFIYDDDGVRQVVSLRLSASPD